VAFGACKKFVIRRAPLRVQRLEERYAENGQIAFIAFRRVDSNLIDGCAGASIAVLQNLF
jgi:HK97 family phage major capsid protein